MNLHLRARVHRWWHCLTHLHRPETVSVADHADGWRTVFIGCECGARWYVEQEGVTEPGRAPGRPEGPTP